MRYLFLLCLLALTGCQGTVGPFKPRSPVPVDDPALPIQEQERRGRDRYGLPDQGPTVGPFSGATRPYR